MSCSPGGHGMSYSELWPSIHHHLEIGRRHLGTHTADADSVVQLLPRHVPLPYPCKKGSCVQTSPPVRLPAAAIFAPRNLSFSASLYSAMRAVTPSSGSWLSA